MGLSNCLTVTFHEPFIWADWLGVSDSGSICPPLGKGANCFVFVCHVWGCGFSHILVSSIWMAWWLLNWVLFYPLCVASCLFRCFVALHKTNNNWDVQQQLDCCSSGAPELQNRFSVTCLKKSETSLGWMQYIQSPEKCVLSYLLLIWLTHSRLWFDMILQYDFQKAEIIQRMNM